MKKLTLVALALAACGPAMENGSAPDLDAVGAVSEAVTPEYGEWNSCYILSQDYRIWTSPNAGGVVCAEQWGSFPAGCVAEGDAGETGAAPQTLPATTVIFARGKRCGQIGYIGTDTQNTTCNYGKFTRYNDAMSWNTGADTYNCVETPPTASAVRVENPRTGVISGKYTYAHPLQAPEGVSTFAWYRLDAPGDVTPLLPLQEPMSRAQDLYVSDGFPGGYMVFCVTPRLHVRYDETWKSVYKCVDSGYGCNEWGDQWFGGHVDGAAGGFAGDTVCSQPQYVGPQNATTRPAGATDVRVSFTGNFAQGDYAYTLDGAEAHDDWNVPYTQYRWTRLAADGTEEPISTDKDYQLAPVDNDALLRFRVTEKSASSGDAVEADSGWVRVGRLLQLYSDYDQKGRVVSLPYEAKGSGHCFANLQGMQINDAVTDLRIDAPVGDKALVILYSDANCSGSTVAWEAPAGKRTGYSLKYHPLNDEISSIRVVWNSKPQALNVGVTIWDNISGGPWNYSDPSGLPESGSTLEFKRAYDASGSGATVIATGVTSRKLEPADNRKYLQFCVTPRNAYFTGDTVCSPWKSVGATVSLFNDDNYGGGGVTFAYTYSSSGACFSLPNFGFNDRTSAYKLFARTTGPTKFVLYRHGNCDPSGGMLNYSISQGGSYLAAVTSSGWNDEISSFRASWDELVTATNVVIDIRGASSTGYWSYEDKNDVPEWGSTYAIQRADDAAGANAVTLVTSTGWVLTPQDDNKFLRFCVTPSNSISFGATTCSSWAPVGRLVNLYQDSNYGGRVVSIAYERTPPNTCFNLPDINFNDQVSSMKFRAGASGWARLTEFEHGACTGDYLEQSVSGTTVFQRSSYGGWNDRISSVRVAY